MTKKMETKTQNTSGLTRRKTTQYVKYCPKEEKNASLKKVSLILQKAEHDRTVEDQQVLGECSGIVADLKSRWHKRDEAKRRIEEIEEPAHVLEEKCKLLAKALAQSEHLIVYTGAGISTAARIPDYRGTNGIWTRLQQGKEIENHDLSLAEPTYTHMALSQLYHQSLLKYIVSQNCDGLHLRSGLPRTALSELHGNMYIEVCKTCKPVREYWRLFDVTENTARYSHKTMRRCYVCNSDLVDTIVHFGERGTLQWPLNWPGACKNADKADTILCLGSSLKVLKKYPWLWQMYRPAKKRANLYIVNLQWTPKDDCAIMKIHGKCDLVMKLVMKHLGVEVANYRREKDPIFIHSTFLCESELHTTTQPTLKETSQDDEVTPKESEISMSNDKEINKEELHTSTQPTSKEIARLTDDVTSKEQCEVGTIQIEELHTSVKLNPKDNECTQNEFEETMKDTSEQSSVVEKIGLRSDVTAHEQCEVSTHTFEENMNELHTSTHPYSKDTIELNPDVTSQESNEVKQIEESTKTQSTLKENIAIYNEQSEVKEEIESTLKEDIDVKEGQDEVVLEEIMEANLKIKKEDLNVKEELENQAMENYEEKVCTNLVEMKKEAHITEQVPAVLNKSEDKSSVVLGNCETVIKSEVDDSINLLSGVQDHPFDLTVNKHRNDHSHSSDPQISCDKNTHINIKTSRLSSQTNGSSSINCTLSENITLPKRKTHENTSLKVNPNIFSIDSILKKPDNRTGNIINSGQNIHTIMAYYELANTMLQNQMLSYISSGVYPYQTSFLYPGIHSIINPLPYISYDFECADRTNTLPPNYINKPIVPVKPEIKTEIVKPSVPSCSFCHDVFRSYVCLYYSRTNSVFIKQITRFSKKENLNKPLVCLCCDYTTDEDSDSVDNCENKLEKEKKKIIKRKCETDETVDIECEIIDENIGDNDNKKIEKIDVKPGKIQAGWFGKGYRKNRRTKKK